MNKIKTRISKLLPKIVGLGLNIWALAAPKSAAKKALDVFCTPREGRVRSYQKKFLEKFEEKVVDCNGISVMTYHRKGSGAKVLLCHGWESNSFRWRKFYRHIKDNDLDLMMMDAPAHGQTGSEKFTAILYAEMMSAVINHFGPSVLIGHSIGAMSAVASLFFHELPSIEKAVLLAPPDKMTDITRNYFKLIGGSKRLYKYYEDAVIEMFGNPSSYYSAANFASRLDIPCLVVHDKDDKINLYEEGMRIHKAWHESKMFTTQNLGHSLQSSEVYNVISEFLNHKI